MDVAHSTLNRIVTGSLFAAALAFSLPSVAAPLPGVIAEASATASVPGDDSGTNTDSGASTASTTNSASASGIAESNADATVDGAARSRSFVESASGSGEASNATATARWVGRVETGGTDPGAPIDIDLGLTLDGFLSTFNNNTNVGSGDLLASVTLQLTLFDMTSGALSVFDGTASLSSTSRTTPPDLLRTGDWADSARDGDFAEVGTCGAFTCQYDVDTIATLDDALLVGFGESFGIEVKLITTAFQAQGRETGAEADFDDTTVISLSSGTPGVTLTFVPEPASATLLALGVGALGAMRRRRSTASTAA